MLERWIQLNRDQEHVDLPRPCVYLSAASPFCKRQLGSACRRLLASQRHAREKRRSPTVCPKRCQKTHPAFHREMSTGSREIRLVRMAKFEHSGHRKNNTLFFAGPCCDARHALCGDSRHSRPAFSVWLWAYPGIQAAFACCADLRMFLSSTFINILRGLTARSP